MNPKELMNNKKLKVFNELKNALLFIVELLHITYIKVLSCALDYDKVEWFADFCKC